MLRRQGPGGGAVGSCGRNGRRDGLWGVMEDIDGGGGGGIDGRRCVSLTSQRCWSLRVPIKETSDNLMLMINC